jgi:hypothetical protein
MWADRRKDDIMAKIAKQTAAYYDDAQRTLAPLQEVDKSWTALCRSKMHFFEAEAQYRQGLVNDSQEKQGEAVSRYRAAVAHLQEAAKHAVGTTFNVKASPHSSSLLAVRCPPAAGHFLAARAACRSHHCGQAARCGEGERHHLPPSGAKRGPVRWRAPRLARGLAPVLTNPHGQAGRD